MEAPVRFKKEKRPHPHYAPPVGTFEVVLQGIRDKLPEDLHVSGEDDFFEKVDEKAVQNMSLGQACFQYYLAGKGHITLAESVMESFGGVRSGNLPEKRKEEVAKELAEFLYDNYPDAYKAQVKK